MTDKDKKIIDPIVLELEKAVHAADVAWIEFDELRQKACKAERIHRDALDKIDVVKGKLVEALGKTNP